jgi:hypothetical protein
VIALSQSLRRLTLTTHVAVSVSWIGAVAAFLVLSVTGLRNQDQNVVRSAYVSMDLVGRYLIVPLSIASLVSGVVQGLVTPWGLFRSYWVSAKLVLTVFATVALLLHQYTAVAAAAGLASTGMVDGTLHARLRGLGVQLTADASLAIVVLLAATALSVYKPWGLTAYGRRLQAQRQGEVTSPSASPNGGMDRGLKIALTLLAMMLLAFILSHLAGGGLGNHGH